MEAIAGSLHQSAHAVFGRVTMTGSLRNSKGLSFSAMRVLGSYALVYLLEGGGHYQLRGQAALPCRAGDLLLIFPDIAHAYGPESGGKWSEIYMVFEGTLFDLWRRQGLLNPKYPILRMTPVDRYAARLRGIAAMGRGSDPARKLLQVCELQTFLAAALAKPVIAGREGGFGSWPGWLVTSIQQMEADLSVPLESIAKSAGVSYESFRKKFRAITGESPARYRSRLTVDLARKLIYEQRLSNKELAEKLHFCDEFHFSRRFRQATGESPKAFRRSLPAIR